MLLLQYSAAPWKRSELVFIILKTECIAFRCRL